MNSTFEAIINNLVNGTYNFSQQPSAQEAQPLTSQDAQAAPENSYKSSFMGDIFKNIVNKTMALEGGFSNNPRDAGGATKYGITWKDNQGALENLGYTQDSLKDLTPEDAQIIYKNKYYNDPGISSLPNDIQGNVFDFGVNSGPATAIKHLQKAVGAPQDGLIGPETLQRVNNFISTHGASKLNQRYLDMREQYLKGLNDKTFLKGWLNRISMLRGATDGEGFA